MHGKVKVINIVKCDCFAEIQIIFIHVMYIIEYCEEKGMKKIKDILLYTKLYGLWVSPSILILGLGNLNSFNQKITL